MKYEIFGDNLPAVTISLENGEEIFTQSGGMAWMKGNIEMNTNTRGGVLKGLGRLMTGESLFMVTYTSHQTGAQITFSSTFPGNIIPFDVSKGEVIIQKNAFLCAQPQVELSLYMTKRASAGFFGGEGFILQKLSGNGIAFLELDGSIKEINLSSGETLTVDTGHVAAFDAKVTYEIQTVKGFKNIMFGGEGLFLTTLTGPGRVWLQTITLPGFAQRLIPFLPKPSSK
ncbi:hypothetical protein SDC9_113416 [bioreactor metagenome]|uniref:TIGR00266 family protein n=1 Tax=bioreactor metagenome TaxID=1076179 RepID=A0A645BN09_9ZZZZ